MFHKMKTWHWLGIAVLLGLILRTVPVWSSIFTNGYVNFASPDSYYQINQIAHYYSSFPHFPAGANLYQVIVASIAWLVTWGHGGISFLDHFVVFIPLLLFVATAAMVYFIGKEVFSTRGGIIAAFAFAIMPGEYLGRSILGEIDYHAFEVFLTTGIILCAVLMFRHFRKWGIELAICFSLLFAVYFQTWLGSLMFLPVLASFAVPLNKWLGVSLITVSTGLMIYTGLHSGLVLSTIGTTQETQPAFTGLFPTLHILLACGLLFMKQGGKFRWPLFTWTLLLIFATLLMRRFDYYLIVPLAILLGGATEIKKKLRRI
jgi:asparagine N-glycosylation enzyme membrane subunit Stt3